MRIIVYGETRREGMPASLATALKDLGHDVRIFDHTRDFYSAGLSFRYAHLLDRVLFSRVAERINDHLRRVLAAWRPQLLVVSKGGHLLPETMSFAASLEICTVSWEFDDPFNIRYVTAVTQQVFREYSSILTPRRHLVEEYRNRGGRAVRYLPFCFDPGVHYPVPLTDHDRDMLTTDIVFVGSWSQKRESYLFGLAEFSIKVWGSSWHHAATSFRGHERINVTGRVVYGPDMSRALRASAIAVNFLTPEQRDQINVRTFEIPACNGFQICERTEELSTVFREDYEVVCFSSPDEILDKCRYYHKRPRLRELIAANAHRRILNDGHTYKDRAKVILQSLT